MLSRWEVEGELRELHPLRRQARQRRAAFAGMRRWAQIACTIGIGALLLAALGVAGVRSVPAPPGVRQWAVWGTQHVSDYRFEEPRFFPGVKRDRGNSYSYRSRIARETVRESHRR